MRLRKKWWARPEMESSDYVITEPKQFKGKWKEVFGNDNPLHLELGCGRGRFITTKAENHSEINYIGIDLKDEVLIYALRKVAEKELPNVRLIPMNIAWVGELFDKDEVDKIYINFCNPWPKLRHNKRRLTHSNFLNIYKGFLKAGSQIWFKTDDEGLFTDSQVYFEESGFTIKYITYDLHKSDFKENVVTEYEEKFTSLGMKTMFLIAELNAAQ
ncbi:tRNA (guanosine(46)-N7)-methyltransferase TrmB [Clostridium thermarum]|uniref:tRNA (guanosine(46)-N7)-methyltransferase TrmB n=1 Tax=Clostridium thermarum TaxID=1716543 RepID=UPI0013D3DDAF|nr:tRNA (guanosine(46)-N7)-methyltransferase TrmB [Clostridium thermarum]